MSIEFDNNLPIYLQIMNHIKRQIVSGLLQPGDKIPSVRELAADLQINPNTIQRTFQELEREEVVETKRGLGRYVTSEESKIMAIKKEMAGELLHQFIHGMQELGFKNQDIVTIVKEAVAAEGGKDWKGSIRMDALLKVNGISKTYGKKQVLDGVSFDIGPGRLVGLRFERQRQKHADANYCGADPGRGKRHLGNGQNGRQGNEKPHFLHAGPPDDRTLDEGEGCDCLLPRFLRGF